MTENVKDKDKKFTDDLKQKGMAVVKTLKPEIQAAAEKHLMERIKIAQVFKNLANASGQVKGNLLPPHHYIFRLLLYTFVIKYRNAGKMSMTCELIAYCPNPDPPGTALKDSQEVLILTDGSSVSRVEFEEIRRQRWPLEHEDGRNPDNVTLGVHHGTIAGKGGMK